MPGRIIAAAVVTVAGLMAGCGGDPPQAPTPTRRVDPVSRSEVLWSDVKTEVDSLAVVISDQSSLATWWQRVTAEVEDPKPAVPRVDFEQHAVLLISGGRMNAGDRVRVDSIGFETLPEAVGGQRRVWFAKVRTIIDCDPFPGQSHPVEVVRLPRTGDLRVDWRVDRSCSDV